MIDNHPRYTSKRMRDEIAKATAYGLELAASLIDGNAIQDTSAGKVLVPRQEGNREGLHYATAIRALTPPPQPNLRASLLDQWREGAFETTADEAAQTALDEQAVGLDVAPIIEAWLTSLAATEGSD